MSTTATVIQEAWPSIEPSARALLCSGAWNPDNPFYNFIFGFLPGGSWYQLQRYFLPADCAVPTTGDRGYQLPANQGRCPGVLYRVRFTIVEPNNFPSDQTNVTITNIVGPITGIYTSYTDIGAFGGSFNVWIKAPNETAQAFSPGLVRFGPSSSSDPELNRFITNVSVTRMDNGTDTCGNPIPGPPTVPTNDQIRFQVPPFNISLGGVTIPIRVSGEFRPAVNIPAFGGIHIPVNLTFAPNVLVPVTTNIPVYLGLPSLEPNFAISLPSFDIDNQIVIPGSAACECLTEEQIREWVADELDNKFRPRRPFTRTFTNYAAANSRIISLPPFSEWVEIDLVDVPVNAKRQPGLNAQDVIYAGWYSFGVNGGAGDRMPIHYREQGVKVPQGATVFSYTVYTGFTATLTVTYLTED